MFQSKHSNKIEEIKVRKKRDKLNMGYLEFMYLITDLSPCRTVANYIMWQVVRYYASALSKPFRNAYLKYKQELYGTKREMPRWQACVISVTDALGMAMGLLFVEQKFTSVTKTSVRRTEKL